MCLYVFPSIHLPSHILLSLPPSTLLGPGTETFLKWTYLWCRTVSATVAPSWLKSQQNPVTLGEFIKLKNSQLHLLNSVLTGTLSAHYYTIKNRGVGKKPNKQVNNKKKPFKLFKHPQRFWWTVHFDRCVQANGNQLEVIYDLSFW